MSQWKNNARPPIVNYVRSHDEVPKSLSSSQRLVRLDIFFIVIIIIKFIIIWAVLRDAELKQLCFYQPPNSCLPSVTGSDSKLPPSNALWLQAAPLKSPVTPSPPLDRSRNQLSRRQAASDGMTWSEISHAKTIHQKTQTFISLACTSFWGQWRIKGNN